MSEFKQYTEENTFILIEDDGCIRFIIEITENKDHFINFNVEEVISWTMKGKVSSTEHYIKGYVKWDGCSHFWFGDKDGYLHLCGKSSWDMHVRVIQTIWRFCGEHIKFDNCAFQ